MTKLRKKHDPLAKKFLTDITIAKEFLQTYLAPELLVRCDLESLTIEPGTYIDEKLALRFSDITYQLDLTKKRGTAYVYCLIEHQSSAKELMPLRILQYQLAIIQRHLDKHKRSTKLPVVAALVFYNGIDSPYPYSLDIAELYPDKESYQQAPLGVFKLVDLTVIEDSELLQHNKLALLEILLKHIHRRDFVNAIAPIISALKVVLGSNISQRVQNINNV